MKWKYSWLHLLLQKNRNKLKTHMGVPEITGLVFYLEYLTVRLSDYMHATTKLDFLALRHGIEYLMYYPHKPIMYSKKKLLKINECPHRCFFKVVGAEIDKYNEYSNFLHTYCDAYHAQDLYDRRSITSIAHLFNGTIIDWCAKKQSDTYISIYNEETREIYKGVLYQNCIRKFFTSIGYPIGPPT